MSMSFREFLIVEAEKDVKYSDMTVRTDKELADATDKIEIRKEKRKKGKEVVKKLKSQRGK